MTVSEYIDQHADDLVARLQHLVRIPTVNPPGQNYEPITAWLTTELQRIGLKARRHPIPARLLKQVLPPEQHAYPRYNVVGKLAAPGARRTLHFNAHYDVVPVSGTWKQGDPFSGAVDGGWIYGRGTSDMKGSIASLLLALQALRATRTPAALNVEVSFTADEETDSELGSGWLVRHAPIAPDYAVVMEGGEGSTVCCGHNGTLWLEVIVHGRAAHGSLPQHGINALEKMSALVLALDDYKAQLARTTWRTPEGKVMSPTVNLGGVFHCGEGAKINTVPAHASFTIDRRVLPLEDHARAERDLRAFLAAAARRIPDCRITVRGISENFSCFSPPTHPFFTAMADCVTQVRREPTTFNVSTGFNDMHFFSHALKIPTLGYGPGGENFHAVNERARLKELIACAKIYARLMTTLV
ncbi:ArgE/DapE family deacylase [Opitutus sp. ER46]|uniref:M20 family metallopeptidase n=1 Tax=Opitutus sp. ER46 TaxID=2161864 RepID=UPI000D3064F5|nr:ArgE/DapE family deacylase [Opitutus sp. ER46]PTX98610.1 acetylornithine deacetylase [Opitutus sp. ER46]